MNTIMAESLDFIATKLEKAVGDDPSKLNGAVQKVLEEIMAEHGSVVYNGDGYTEAWHKEAEKRGLPNLRSCVEALPLLGSKEATELFAKYGVLTERELHSRMEIYLEQYCLVVGLEARTAIEMAKTIIFPAAIRYQGELAATCANLKAVGYIFDTDTLDKVTGAGEGPAGRNREARRDDGRARRSQQARPREASVQRGAARDGGGAQDRRHARRHRRRRLVAVGDVPGDALHHVGA